ncbi:hypothetical protein ElyMa_001309800 [Elysia marginata]|uniref:Uncharacterized protein n=1 Tax=Elysia marginata TaxID=1093978 RepID=A0AAV4IKZ1_9GAST|nr:hypothetical protein ElyMa_001309800 [Elysia marginata]
MIITRRVMMIVVNDDDGDDDDDDDGDDDDDDDDDSDDFDDDDDLTKTVKSDPPKNPNSTPNKIRNKRGPSRVHNSDKSQRLIARPNNALAARTGPGALGRCCCGGVERVGDSEDMEKTERDREKEGGRKGEGKEKDNRQIEGPWSGLRRKRDWGFRLEGINTEKIEKKKEERDGKKLLRGKEDIWFDCESSFV